MGSSFSPFCAGPGRLRPYLEARCETAGRETKEAFSLPLLFPDSAPRSPPFASRSAPARAAASPRKGHLEPPPPRRLPARRAPAWAGRGGRPVGRAGFAGDGREEGDTRARRRPLLPKGAPWRGQSGAQHGDGASHSPPPRCSRPLALLLGLACRNPSGEAFSWPGVRETLPAGLLQAAWLYASQP